MIKIGLQSEVKPLVSLTSASSNFSVDEMPKKGPLKKAPKKRSSNTSGVVLRAGKSNASKPGKTVVFEVRSTVLFRKEQNLKVSILNLEDQTAYQTSGIGACLWLMLDGQTSNEKIVEALKEALKVSSPQLDTLAKKFFDDIFLKNLVQIIPSSKVTKTPKIRIPFSSAELKELRTIPKANIENVVLAHREVAAACGTSMASSFYTTCSSCGT